MVIGPRSIEKKRKKSFLFLFSPLNFYDSIRLPFLMFLFSSDPFSWNKSFFFFFPSFFFFLLVEAICIYGRWVLRAPSLINIDVPLTLVGEGTLEQIVVCYHYTIESWSKEEKKRWSQINWDRLILLFFFPAPFDLGKNIFDYISVPFSILFFFTMPQGLFVVVDVGN